MTRVVYRKPRTRSKTRYYHTDPGCHRLSRYNHPPASLKGRPRRLKQHDEAYARQFWAPCGVCC